MREELRQPLLPTADAPRARTPHSPARVPLLDNARGALVCLSVSLSAASKFKRKSADEEAEAREISLTSL